MNSNDARQALTKARRAVADARKALGDAHAQRKAALRASAAGGTSVQLTAADAAITIATQQLHAAQSSEADARAQLEVAEAAEYTEETARLQAELVRLKDVANAAGVDMERSIACGRQATVAYRDAILAFADFHRHHAQRFPMVQQPEVRVDLIGLSATLRVA